MRDRELHELLGDALELWVDLSGVDPSGRSFRMGDLDVLGMHRDIEQAIQLDPSLVTAFLLLDAYSQSYFKERTFSVDQLLAAPEKTEAYLAKTREFLALVRNEEFVSMRDAFVDKLRLAVAHYGAEGEDLEKLLASTLAIGTIRRDALKSIDGLRVDQFLTGEAEEAGRKPVYFDTVHQFWNMNSMLAHGARMPSGVSLSLVRTPDAMSSYFVFMIRNGGNLYSLSDVPIRAHPLQAELLKSRRPERDFMRRTSQNRFPYDLLDLRYDEEYEAFFVEESTLKGVIPFQRESHPLKKLSQLHADEIVWITLMFDLIVERFWTRGFQAPAISTTGEALSKGLALEYLNIAEQAGLPAVFGTTSPFQPLVLDDVSLQAEDAITAYAGKSSGTHRHLEERFAASVPADFLNQVGAPSEVLYLPGNGGSHFSAPSTSMEIVRDKTKRAGDIDRFEARGRQYLSQYRLDAFGTVAEIESDRRYIARFNYAKAIERLAEGEFAARKDAVRAWFLKAARKNLDAILPLAAKPETWMAKESIPGVEYKCTSTNEKHPHFPNSFLFATTHALKDKNDMQRLYDRHVLNYQALMGESSNAYQSTCVLTDAGASYVLVVAPQTARDIALLAGCTVDELPVEIRQWARHRDHRGNHLLDRVDPMDWAIEDPWSRECFSLRIYLSKRGLTRVGGTTNR